MRNTVNIFLLLMFFSSSISAQVFFDRYETTVELLPLINSSGSEISPAIVNNELFFTAMRHAHSGGDPLQEKNDLFYSIYFSDTDEYGYPQVLPRIVEGFGKEIHEGPASWCESTGELFVTLSNLSEREMSQRNRNRKNVKLRIAVMKLEEDTWKVVQELPFVKGEFNYAHPAISPTGDTLVFSSDMSGGHGNSDLYISVRSGEEWSEPVNLGDSINTPGNELFPTFGPEGLLLFSSDGRQDSLGSLDIYYTSFKENSSVVNLGVPINSMHDDFGLVIHPDYGYGYFASTRSGSGNDDIYRVELVSLYETIGGTIMDNSDMPVADATVTLQDCNGNELQKTTSGPNGKFSFEVSKGQCYQALATKKGYDPDQKAYHLEKSVLLNMVQRTIYQIYAIDIEDQEPVSGIDINCDEQQWQTDQFGYASLNTDSLGSCNLIISGDEYFSYILEADPYRFSPGDNVTDTIRLYKKELNKAYTFNNIEFFLDKWRLLPQSEQELGKLIKLMKDNPSLKIEMASHTDSRGEAQYNQWLSKKRSDSAKDYLIENGISGDRIVSKGYGETRLINHCANGVQCSEAEHLENRRTEFVILAF